MYSIPRGTLAFNSVYFSLSSTLGTTTLAAPPMHPTPHIAAGTHLMQVAAALQTLARTENTSLALMWGSEAFRKTYRQEPQLV